MIKLYGAEYCKPCNMAKLALDRESIEYEFVDVDKNPEEVQRLGIKSIPVLVKSNGDMLRGDEYNGVKELMEWVNAT